MDNRQGAQAGSDLKDCARGAQIRCMQALWGSPAKSPGRPRGCPVLVKKISGFSAFRVSAFVQPENSSREGRPVLPELLRHSEGVRPMIWWKWRLKLLRES